jgi:hypothetical protein
MEVALHLLHRRQLALAAFHAIQGDHDPAWNCPSRAYDVDRLAD